MHFDVTLIGARDFAEMVDVDNVCVPYDPLLHALKELMCIGLYLHAAMLLKLFQSFSSQRSFFYLLLNLLNSHLFIFKILFRRFTKLLPLTARIEFSFGQLQDDFVEYSPFLVG